MNCCAINDIRLFYENNVRLPLFSKVSKGAIGSMTRATNFLIDFQAQGDDEVKTGLIAVGDFLGGIVKMEEGNIGFMAIIVGLPHLTAALRKARQRTVNILKKLNDEIIATKSLTLELEKLLKDMLNHVMTEK